MGHDLGGASGVLHRWVLGNDRGAVRVCHAPDSIEVAVMDEQENQEDWLLNMADLVIAIGLVIACLTIPMVILIVFLKVLF